MFTSQEGGALPSPIRPLHLLDSTQLPNIYLVKRNADPQFQAARVGSIQAAYRAHEVANPSAKVPEAGAVRSLGLIEKQEDSIASLTR